MENKSKKYIIGEVLDNATQKRSEFMCNHVGKECYIMLLKVGECMVLQYPNGGVFWVHGVKEVEQTDYGFWVKTENYTYRLDIEAFYK